MFKVSASKTRVASIAAIMLVAGSMLTVSDSFAMNVSIGKVETTVNNPDNVGNSVFEHLLRDYNQEASDQQKASNQRHRG